MALSVGSRPPDVIWHHDPRSPDFPLPKDSDCPANSPAVISDKRNNSNTCYHRIHAPHAHHFTQSLGCR